MSLINQINIEVHEVEDDDEVKYLIQGIDDIYWTDSKFGAANIVEEELVKIEQLGNKNIFSNQTDVSNNQKSAMTFDQIITKIKQIIDIDQIFKLEFYSSQICFCIYEKEVVISYTSKDDLLCVDCELTEGKLDTEMVGQICEIMNMLEQNKELLKNFC